MGKAATTAKVLASGAKVAVKYGPQAKIAWDNGGKQAGAAAGRRALSVNARRKALKQAATLHDGSVLKVAPEGKTVYVVFAGDQPVASYPPSKLPWTVLLAHADLTRRVKPARG